MRPLASTGEQREARPRRAELNRGPAALALACVLALACTLALPARAADIHVDATSGSDARDGLSWPASLATIGRALLVARGLAGADTIHVAAGTYRENLRVTESGVTLLGGYPRGGGTRDAAANATIVDAAAAGPALEVSGAGGTVALADITIDGFTFTNGRSLVRGGTAFGGAGAFIEEAAVALTNNVIASNVADGAAASGAGVYVYRVTAGPAVIRGNRIEGNVAQDGLGGGAWLWDAGDASALGALVFEDNAVSGNTARATTDVDPTSANEINGAGGGLFVLGGATLVRGNTFTGNVAEALVDLEGNGQGGGLFAFDGAPVISSNVIRGNSASAQDGRFGAAGGGAYVLSASGRIEGNTVEANQARGGGGDDQAYGAGINVTLGGAQSPVLSNNVIRDNLASGGAPGSARGGGLYVFVAAGSGGQVRVEGGSVEANATPYAGGGAWLYAEDAGALVLEGADVIGNRADFASGVMSFGNVDVRHARVRANAVYDPDGDEVSEIKDDCPGLANGDQADADGDLTGDACDWDDDGDGVLDGADNCPLVDNATQQDSDGDRVGDACEGDMDADGWADAVDNCPVVANSDQNDATANGVGDACEPARFDPLETNASGVWVAGDGTVTNVEIVENVGQGLQVVGVPGDPASPVITNVTIAANEAAGFITYLADGTLWRDSIMARNLLSDGFDTEDAGGNPSSPAMDCDHVFFGDGLGSLPCTGPGNMAPDFLNGRDMRFATGPRGAYYLAQTAAGQAQDSMGVDAGSRDAAASPVVSRTTRTDAAPDSGVVDIGYHHETAAPPPAGDPLATALRVREGTGNAPTLALDSPPPTVTAVRYYRGELDLLPTEYSHVSPFSGQAGNPECSVSPSATFADTAVLRDGRNWYYLAVTLSGSNEGSFGADSAGVERPRPADSPTDRVLTTCP